MKKNFVKTLIMAMAVTAMVGTTGITSFAAETATTTQTTKQTLDVSVVAKVFDAAYYAEKNPDVVAVIGNDPAALLQHYIDFGIYEGRDASATFNATIYAAANTDLMTAFGENIEALIKHYINFGINENRVASNDQLKASGKSLASVVASSSGSSAGAASGSDSSAASTSGTSTTSGEKTYINVLTGELTTTPSFGCVSMDEFTKYDGTNTIVTEWDFSTGTAASTAKLGETYRVYDDAPNVVRRVVGGIGAIGSEVTYATGDYYPVDHESSLSSEAVAAVNEAVESIASSNASSVLDEQFGEWD